MSSVNDNVSENGFKLCENNFYLDEYQALCKGTDQNAADGLEGLAFLLLGLFGEVGTLLSALKKKRRDRESFVGYQDAIIEEFGDALWYFANIASRASLSINILAQRMFRDLRDWDEVGEYAFGTFGDIQGQKDPAGSADSEAFELALISLAGKVGLLLNDFHLGKLSSNRDVLSGHLVEVFRAFISAADIADIDLGVVAVRNVRKIHSRWPIERSYLPRFDAEFNEFERLPQRIEMRLFETRIGKKVKVIQQFNGVNIGAKLTDRKGKDDDYRYHDVIHLAFLAILSWSPVMRGLLNLKRTGLLETEDGFRATFIEEGLVTLIFHRAIRLNYFKGIEALDYSLLKLIPEFVDGFEVSSCPLWQWEKAILDGFGVLRRFRQERQGVVIADLGNRSITYRLLESDEPLT